MLESKYHSFEQFCYLGQYLLTYQSWVVTQGQEETVLDA